MMSVFEQHISTAHAVPHLVLRHAPRQSLNGLYKRFGKRLCDVIFLIIAAPVVLPVVMVLAAVIALDGGRPFYVQQRVGKHGAVFDFYKLRTMVANADHKLEAYLADNPQARAEWELTQKLKDDPRITTFGRILRQLSLDELPQLLNVLKGDMSLVGPRPMMPDQQSMYPGLAYYTLLPGITGSWQVSKRNEVLFAQRADFDTQYFREIGLITDLKLMYKTVGAVISLSGY